MEGKLPVRETSQQARKLTSEPGLGKIEKAKITTFRFVEVVMGETKDRIENVTPMQAADSESDEEWFESQSRIHALEGDEESSDNDDAEQEDNEGDEEVNEDVEWDKISTSEKYEAQTNSRSPNNSNKPPTVPLEDEWMVCNRETVGNGISVISEFQHEQENPGRAPEDLSPTESEADRLMSLSLAELWDSIQQDLAQTHPPLHAVEKLRMFICLREEERRKRDEVEAEAEGVGMEGERKVKR